MVHTKSQIINILSNFNWKTLPSLVLDEYAWSVIKHIPGVEGILLRRSYLRCLAKKYTPSPIIQKSVTIRSSFGFSFGKNLYVNRGSFLEAYGGLELGDNVGIGPNVTIITNDHSFLTQGTDYYTRDFIPRKVTIGDNTMICAHCFINPGVTIGSNCIVAAGTSVYVDIPDNTYVAPAPIVKYTKSVKQSIRNMKEK